MMYQTTKRMASKERFAEGEKSFETLSTAMSSAKQEEDNFLFTKSRVGTKILDQEKTNKDYISTWNKNFFHERLRHVIRPILDNANGIEFDSWPSKKSLIKIQYSTKNSSIERFKLYSWFQNYLINIKRPLILPDILKPAKEFDSSISNDFNLRQNSCSDGECKGNKSSYCEQEVVKINQEKHMSNVSYNRYSRFSLSRLKWTNYPRSFKCFRNLFFVMYLVFLGYLYQSESSVNYPRESHKALSLVYTLLPQHGLSMLLFVTVSNSFADATSNTQDSRYGAQDNLNGRSHSIESFSSLRSTQTNKNNKNDDSNHRYKSSSIHIDNQNRSYKNYISSFSSSSYDPRRAPNIIQRTFSEIQLGQLFRSAGCVNDEIKLVSDLYQAIHFLLLSDNDKLIILSSS